MQRYVDPPQSKKLSTPLGNSLTSTHLCPQPTFFSKHLQRTNGSKVNISSATGSVVFRSFVEVC
jgi:hypothetical protein